jgi:hypothetical protein
MTVTNDVLNDLTPDSIELVRRTQNPTWRRLLMTGDRLCREADARITRDWQDERLDKNYVASQVNVIRAQVRQQVTEAFDELESEIVMVTGHSSWPT